MPVGAAKVAAGDINITLNALGTVTPLRNVTVSAQISGQLLEVKFKEGQMVQQGDVLAEIDPRPYQAALMQAEGALARDQALLANSKIDLERYQTLFKQDSIAKQQVDTQMSLVRQYEGAVRVDRNQIDSARLQLSYTKVVAPVSGRVGLRLVDPGNIVHASDAGGLAVVTQLRPIDVVFTIPEDALPAVLAKVRAGERPAVDAFDREGSQRLASGTLLTLDNTIDPATGTVRLKAEFPNDDEALFPNQFVNARLELDVHHGATLVPEAAVQRGTQGTFVWVVTDDGTVDMRSVTIGVSEGVTSSGGGGGGGGGGAAAACAGGGGGAGVATGAGAKAAPVVPPTAGGAAPLSVRRAVSCGGTCCTVLTWPLSRSEKMNQAP